VKRCDAILGTGFAGTVIGALVGVVLAHGPEQMLVYAVLGVWGGALGGALLGACFCALQLGTQDRGARRDLRTEPAKKLRPAGL
jgi:hypothetical protein